MDFSWTYFSFSMSKNKTFFFLFLLWVWMKSMTGVCAGIFTCAVHIWGMSPVNPVKRKGIETKEQVSPIQWYWEMFSLYIPYNFAVLWPGNQQCKVKFSCKSLNKVANMDFTLSKIDGDWKSENCFICVFLRVFRDHLLGSCKVFLDQRKNRNKPKPLIQKEKATKINW